jgi:hypothetical protein
MISQCKSANYKPQKYPIFKMIVYLIFLFFHIILIHFLNPMSKIFQIMFLTTIAFVAPDEDTKSSEESISNAKVYIEAGIITVGWIILLIFPIISLFTRGMKIIVLQESLISKLFTAFYLIIECFFTLPTTFFLSNSAYSIYLFEERGIEQFISPYLIFFPTDYTTSAVELIRHTIEPIFFIIFGFVKNEQIKGNYIKEFLVILLQIMVILCIITFIGNIFIIIYKINKKIKSKPFTEEILKSKNTIKQENIGPEERKLTDIQKEIEDQIIPTNERKDKIN